MRKKRRIGGVLLIIIAIIIMQLPVESAEAAVLPGFTVEGTKVISYTGSEKTVSIPAGTEVIGGSAFENNQTMEKVVFPNSLKRIGSYAFWGCDSLTEITFGKGLKEVGDYAFTSCRGLGSVQVPGQMTSIGIQAFADCANLTDITIPAGVTYIHETAFDGCSKLVIHCPEGSYASKYAEGFYRRQAQFTEYEDVPGYEPTPDEEEPSASGGESVEDDKGILGSTSVVGNHAVVFIDNRRPTVYQGVIPSRTPVEPEELCPVKYRIVDGKIVADQAYYKDTQLEDIVLPQGILEVGEFSFARCGAKSLTLPEGLEKISYGAFYHCDSLGAVELPGSLTTVEPKAFEHTAWLDCFRQGLSQEQGDFLVSGGVLVAYRGDQDLVELPGDVRVIAAECFQGCDRLEKLILPDQLTHIGEAAFENCSSLKEIVWNDRVVKIADRAFAGCSFSEMTLPASVEFLGTGAFDDNVILQYGGKAPQLTYETSAQRLSNDAFRQPLFQDRDQGKGVLVLGMEGARASLAGAERPYTLTLEEEASEMAEQAFQRNLGGSLPEDARCYRLTLCDSSGIPIQKLGKRELTVSMPIPVEYQGKELQAFMYDRNGQLDLLELTYVRSGETTCLQFQTTVAYGWILVPTEQKLAEQVIQESDITMSQGAGRSDEPVSAASHRQGEISHLQILKWSLGGLLLLAGLFLALTRINV